MKDEQTRRRDAIFTLVNTQRVPNQAALKKLLLREGFLVTQSTISRDLQVLHIERAVDQKGARYYVVSSLIARPTFTESETAILRALLTQVEWSENLVLCTTPAGKETALKEALDRRQIPGIIGFMIAPQTVMAITKPKEVSPLVASALHTVISSNEKILKTDQSLSQLT